MQPLKEINPFKSSWNFPEELTKRSKASTFKEAVREWTIVDVTMLENGESDHCLCSHLIHEVIKIKNVITGEIVKTGNHCIKQIEEPGTPLEGAHLVTQGLNRIQCDSSAAPNKAVIAYALNRGFITTKDGKFLEETCKKRKLSKRQQNYRQALNQRILQKKTASKTKDRIQRHGKSPSNVKNHSITDLAISSIVPPIPQPQHPVATPTTALAIPSIVPPIPQPQHPATTQKTATDETIREAIQLGVFTEKNAEFYHRIKSHIEEQNSLNALKRADQNLFKALNIKLNRIKTPGNQLVTDEIIREAVLSGIFTKKNSEFYFRIKSYLRQKSLSSLPRDQQNYFKALNRKLTSSKKLFI